MSLIDEMMTPCVYMVKTKTPDGEGGYTTGWTEGVTFNATIVRQSSMLATIAEAIKEKTSYTVTIANGMTLDYMDVIKRVSDGATFKITSNSSELKAPNSSTLGIAQVTAERWDLT